MSYIEKIIKVIEEIEKRGERIYYTEQARRYLQIKNYEKAVEYLYKAYDIHDPNLPYANTRRYDAHLLKDHPAYVELIKKMELPLEQ